MRQEPRVRIFTARHLGNPGGHCESWDWKGNLALKCLAEFSFVSSVTSLRLLTSAIECQLHTRNLGLW